MPKVQCVCNEIISIGEIPCPNEYLFIADQAYDNYSGKIDSEQLYQNMKSFILCLVAKDYTSFGKASIKLLSYIPQHKKSRTLLRVRLFYA